MSYHISITTAIEQLAKESDSSFVTVLQEGNMQVELFAPMNTDKQSPHGQDGLYIIAAGSGTFNRNGERTPLKKGDVIFVPALMEHFFENFTDDFASWIVFYGNTK
jgi:mannose-6-phosphate isomerase-like protein (cupin superfamily)